MKCKFFLLFLAGLISQFSNGQYIHKIKADSLLVTNDSCNAELNLENATRHVNGFLYNKGNGRTEFRKGLIRVNDSTYIIGTDTLKIKSSAGSGAPAINLTTIGTSGPATYNSSTGALNIPDYTQIPAYTSMTQLSDSSFTLNRFNGTKDTVVFNLSAQGGGPASTPNLAQVLAAGSTFTGTQIITNSGTGVTGDFRIRTHNATESTTGEIRVQNSGIFAYSYGGSSLVELEMYPNFWRGNMQGNTNMGDLYIDDGSLLLRYQNLAGTAKKELKLSPNAATIATNGNAGKNIALSVNNVLADANGNIDIAVGGAETDPVYTLNGVPKTRTISLVQGNGANISGATTQALSGDVSWTVKDEDDYRTATQLSDTSYSLNRPNGTKTVFIFEGGTSSATAGGDIYANALSFSGSTLTLGRSDGSTLTTTIIGGGVLTITAGSVYSPYNADPVQSTGLKVDNNGTIHLQYARYDAPGLISSGEQVIAGWKRFQSTFGGGISTENAGEKTSSAPNGLFFEDKQFGGSMTLNMRGFDFALGSNYTVYLPKQSGILLLKVNNRTAANSTGAVEAIYSSTAPGNSSTPVAWGAVEIGGSTYKIPLYQ